MRIGLEIEGRLKGINTLFVDVSELDRFHRNLDRYFEEYGREVAQVYIDYPVKLNDTRLEDISKKWYLTVETDQINESIPNYIGHVMYSIKDENILRLRDQDSFKVVTESKNLLCSSVESTFKTLSEEFDGVDTEIPVYS